ncbi:restriction endonuclease subunit S [Alcaligenaceae bacterium]|nr:restriction endonuclease subunit S [Alcaligenaceae bacterium]
MSFSKYPAYKDSGVEWLGEIPMHWKTRKIAWNIPYVVGWTPPSGNDGYYGGELPWVTIADITQDTVEDTASKITDKAVKQKNARVVPAGSLLFSFKLSVGKVAFLSVDSYTNGKRPPNTVWRSH